MAKKVYTYYIYANRTQKYDFRKYLTNMTVWKDDVLFKHDNEVVTLDNCPLDDNPNHLKIIEIENYHVFANRYDEYVSVSYSTLIKRRKKEIVPIMISHLKNAIIDEYGSLESFNKDLENELDKQLLYYLDASKSK